MSSFDGLEFCLTLTDIMRTKLLVLPVQICANLLVVLKNTSRFPKLFAVPTNTSLYIYRGFEKPKS
jgi:hypothetical protein